MFSPLLDQTPLLDNPDDPLALVPFFFYSIVSRLEISEETATVIHLLSRPATPDQIEEMLQEHEGMVKIVVDIRRGILAGGGEMHADGETLLLENGSEQDDLWGANWYPGEQRIAFESLINIRPALGNRSIVIQDQSIRREIERLARELLGGVR